MGGEAARPLYYARYLRQRGYQIKLLTHARCRKEFTEEHADLLRDTTFIEDTTLHKLIWFLTKWMPPRVREFSGGQLLGVLTDRSISKHINTKMHGQIDIVHQPVPISPKFLRGIRTNLPLVIGPLNGGINYPPAYSHRESPLVQGFIRIGRWLAPALHRLFPIHPTMLVVSNERTEKSLPFRLEPSRIRKLRANAVNLAQWNRTCEHKSKSCVRIVTMSRLTRFKCIDLLIEAFAASEILRREAELVIIGNGEERAALEGLAQKCGISEQVRFRGWMTHKQAIEELLQCDIFAFPSLQDPGGAVIMEAACVGLPVVCADWGGPAEYLPKGGGIAVSVKTTEEYINGLRYALERLTTDWKLRSQMGALARQAAENSFDWDKRVDVLEKIYHEAMQVAYGLAREGKSSGVAERI